jgi:16S rRNA processing protein RimM
VAASGQAPSRLVVGRIVRPHGLRGEVMVETLTDAPDRFTPGTSLGAGDPDSGALRTVTIATARSHTGRLLLTFEGLADRESADALRGELLSIPFAEARELGPDEFWPHQLVGLSVVAADGEPVGAVAEVQPGAAHDLLSVQRPDGSTALIPAVAAIVTVDLEAGRVTLADLPGLIDP